MFKLIFEWFDGLLFGIRGMLSKEASADDIRRLYYEIERDRLRRGTDHTDSRA